jgi:hypothetical protein
MMLNFVVTQELIVIAHFYSGYVYGMYYSVIIASVMMPHVDSGETKHLCLRVKCHNWQPIVSYNTFLESFLNYFFNGEM